MHDSANRHTVTPPFHGTGASRLWFWPAVITILAIGGTSVVLIQKPASPLATAIVAPTDLPIEAPVSA